MWIRYFVWNFAKNKKLSCASSSSIQSFMFIFFFKYKSLWYENEKVKKNKCKINTTDRFPAHTNTYMPEYTDTFSIAYANKRRRKKRETTQKTKTFRLPRNIKRIDWKRITNIIKTESNGRIFDFQGTRRKT